MSEALLAGGAGAGPFAPRARRTRRAIVPAIARHDHDLADQLTRAANSVFLNLCEGRKRLKGDRVRFFGYASGSAGEVRAALDLAVTWGWIATAWATPGGSACRSPSARAARAPRW